MDIQLLVNSSEVNKINKTITPGVTLSGTLKNESNVVSPVILITIDNPTAYNYAYIKDFGRYYFIRDFVSVRTNIWQVQLESDPLMSFKSQILNCSAILDESTDTGNSNYLTGRQWVNSVKSKTDIINFSNGLLENGEFILITAGG